MKKFVRIGLIVFGALAIALAAWLFYRSTPQYSLKQLIAAVEQRNRIAFERYIDVEKTVQSAVDDILHDLIDAAIDSARIANDPFFTMGAALGAAMVEGLKPLAVKTMTNAILEGVESGSIIDALSDQGTAVEDMESLNITASVSMDDARFAGISGIQKSYNKATVGLDFYYESLDTTLTAHIVMEDKGNYWQVVGVKGLGEFILNLMSIEEARLAEVNQPIQARLAQLIELGDFENKLIANGWDEVALELAVPVKNVSGTDLRNIQLRITGKDGFAESVQFQTVDFLGPFQEKLAHTSLNVLSFSSLYEALIREDKGLYALEFVSAEVRNGDAWETIALYPTWSAYRTRAID